MKTLLESLRAELSEKSAEANAILDKKDRTAEEGTKALKLINELKGVKARIETELAVEASRSDLGEIKSWSEEADRRLPFSAKGGDGASVMEGSTRAGMAELYLKNGHLEDWRDTGPGTFGEKAWDAFQKKGYAQSFRKFLKKGERGLSELERKDLQIGLDEQGGTFAPAEFMATVIGRKPAPTEMINYVTKLTTGSPKLVMPRLQYNADDKYTTAIRVTKTGEIPASSTAARVTDTNLTGTVSIDVNTFMMTLPIGRDLLEDSVFPVDAWIAGKFAETYRLFIEDKILNGTGASEPDGILNNAAAGDANRPEVVLSGAAGAVGYSGLIDLQTALAPQYDEPARFIMNKKSTYRAINKILDSSNRPIFTRGTLDAGLTEARSMMLLGDPISFSQFAPNIGSTNYPIVYGDLKGYYHLDRIGFSVEVLREINAQLNQVVVVGRFRVGGAVVEPWRLKIQKSNNS